MPFQENIVLHRYAPKLELQATVGRLNLFPRLIVTTLENELSWTGALTILKQQGFHQIFEYLVYA